MNAPDLLKQELLVDVSYLKYSVLSLALNVVFFRLVSPLFWRAISPTYKALSDNQKLEWDGRVTADVNCLLVSLVGTYTLLYDPLIVQHKVWYASVAIRVASAIFVGYMVADYTFIVVWGLRSPTVKDYLTTTLYHSSIIFFCGLGSVIGKGMFHLALRQNKFISTPFLNQRWFFGVLNFPTDNVIVVMNRVILFLAYLCFRVVIIPYTWYHLIANMLDPHVVEAFGVLLFIGLVPVICIDVLNILWFYKLTKGLAAEFRYTKKSASSASVSKGIFFSQGLHIKSLTL